MKRLPGKRNKLGLLDPYPLNLPDPFPMKVLVAVTLHAIREQQQAALIHAKQRARNPFGS